MVYRNVIASIEKCPELWDVGILHSFDCDLYYPFNVNGGNFQFIREVIEEEPAGLMTNRQLAEWCAKGNGQFKTSAYSSSAYRVAIGCDNETVCDDILICTWDSEKWVIPTVDIYERDCKGGNK